MRRHSSRIGLALLGALLFALASLPLPAAAEGREFNGEVLRAGEKRLVVKNRMGDKRRFHRSPETRVEGRPGWKALVPGDRVIVEYTRDGERNLAGRVIVLRPGG